MINLSSNDLADQDVESLLPERSFTLAKRHFNTGSQAQADSVKSIRSGYGQD